jgi:hypothetical protein
MRDLEARLTPFHQPVNQLAADIYGGPPTAAQIRSAQRAAHRLADLGRAKVSGGRYLVVRTPLTAEDIERARQLYEAVVATSRGKVPGMGKPV